MKTMAAAIARFNHVSGQYIILIQRPSEPVRQQPVCGSGPSEPVRQRPGTAGQPGGNKYRFGWASELSDRNEESGTIMDTESISRDCKQGKLTPRNRDVRQGFAKASRVV